VTSGRDQVNSSQLEIQLKSLLNIAPIPGPGHYSGAECGEWVYLNAVKIDRRYGLAEVIIIEEAEKLGAKRRSPPRPDFLQAGDVRCLQALGAGGDFEFNRLAFVQRFVPLRLNRGEVDEDVLAGLALDESESLAGIEPLYCSLFFHGVSFSLI